MVKKSQQPYRGLSRFVQVAIGLLLVSGVVLSVSLLLAAGASRLESRSNPLRQNTPVTWKTASKTRPSISFTFRYPPEWESPYEHCNTPPNPKNLSLSANCIKITIITDRFPPEDTEEDSISDTPIRVSGYEARRKLYAAPGDRSKTPYDYELWIYDEGHPIFYLVGYIGAGTDLSSATQFVQVFNTMVGSLEIDRH